MTDQDKKAPAQAPPPPASSNPATASSPTIDSAWEDLDVTELGLADSTPTAPAGTVFSAHDAPTVRRIRSAPPAAQEVVTVVHLEIVVPHDMHTHKYGEILDAIKQAAIDAGASAVTALKIIDVAQT